MKNENECKVKNTEECNNKRSKKECIIRSCSRLFAIKLGELIDKK